MAYHDFASNQEHFYSLVHITKTDHWLRRTSISPSTGKEGQGGIVALCFVIHGWRSTRARVIYLNLVICVGKRSGTRLPSGISTALVIPVL